ncbi:MAG TPA: alpha/beta hydrolase [Acidimicrobiia bacterium]|nr:alpha/beta hydrolase [Acidimicrobiia bacterium]
MDDMLWSWVLLGLSVWGALWTAVALRPPRRPVHAVALTFFAAWLTTEMVLVHLAWQVVVLVVLVALGALDAWPGWLALGVTALSWTGMLVIAREATRADARFARAFDGALGDDWRDLIDPTIAPEAAARLEWGRVWMPFRFRRRGVERIRNVPYVTESHRRHRLDVYRRPDAGPGAPVLLQIHGGGWVIGAKEQQGLPLMYHLAERGWVCIAINYRLSPRATWPDQLIDCKHALRWIREHVAEYGGDPDFVAVTGGSAGGHLTTMVALTANEPQYQPGFEQVDTSVRAMVPFYGVYDWTDRFGLRGARDPLRRLLERAVMKVPRDEAPERYADASPMNHLRPDTPPALVIHGSLDNLVPVDEARHFAAMLRDVSTNPVVYVELPGAHHAFDVFHSVRTLHAVAAVDAFLSWTLSVSRSAPSAPPRDAP